MPTWLTLVLALGGSAIISTLVGRIFNKHFKKQDDAFARAKAQEDQDQQNLQAFKEQKEREQRVSRLKELIDPLAASINALNANISKIAEGTLCTLRNDITTLYYRCCEKGYRNDYDCKNIHDLFEAYEALGGNSYIKDIMKRFEELPAKEMTVPTKVVIRKTVKNKTKKEN